MSLCRGPLGDVSPHPNPLPSGERERAADGEAVPIILKQGHDSIRAGHFEHGLWGDFEVIAHPAGA